MNRRRFIQSLAAAITLPAMPLKPVMAALPASASPAGASAAAAQAMATKARFWAIYMYGLQGNCTPATLSTILNVPETQARGYLTNLIADGTIRPHALLRTATSKALGKSVEKKAWRLDEGVLERAEEYVGWQWEDEGAESLFIAPQEILTVTKKGNVV